jgi:hypothetical protein
VLTLVDFEHPLPPIGVGDHGVQTPTFALGHLLWQRTICQRPVYILDEGPDIQALRSSGANEPGRRSLYSDYRAMRQDVAQQGHDVVLQARHSRMISASSRARWEIDIREHTSTVENAPVDGYPPCSVSAMITPMIEVVSGSGVWEQLEDHLTGGEKRSAAIAYIGARANEWLRLKDGDVLVFDGDDKSIRQCLVDLRVIGKLMRAGVHLYSCPGLHAKVMVIESMKATAIVGSANASMNSVERKAEAVVVTDEPGPVNQARAAIVGWHLGQGRLSPAWLKRVNALPKAPQVSGTIFVPRELPPPDDPKRMLWVIEYEWEDAAWEDDVRSAITTTQQETGSKVDAFPLRRRNAAYRAIGKDDYILFVTWSSRARTPRANTRVEEPWVVLDKLDRGQSGDLLVGTRPKARSCQWAEVSRLLGIQDPSGPPQPITNPSKRAALLKLFQP